MNRGQFQRNLLVVNGAGEDHDGEPDPQDKPEDRPVHPGADADLVGQDGDHRGDHEVSCQFNEDIPGRWRAGDSVGLVKCGELAAQDPVPDPLMKKAAAAAAMIAR
jgi:hypothetical protein